ncbi:MAG: sugar transferase [Actinomycetota bacterium]
MIRRHITALRLSLMSVDAFSAIAVFVVVSIIRFGPAGWVTAWALTGIEMAALLATYAAAWATMMWLLGMYRLRARWTVRSEALDVIRAGTLLAVLTFAALYVVKLPQVSRLFLIELFPAQIAVTFASRLILRALFGWARERGLNTRFVLMVGTGPTAQSFADRIERHRDLGLRVLGHLSPAPDPGGEVANVGELGPDGSPFTPTRPIFGSVDEIEDVLHDQVVDEVVICLPPARWGLVEAITRICLDEGKLVRVPLIEGSLSLPGARTEDFDGIPLLSLVYGSDRILALVSKRLLDIGLAVIALVLLSPFLLVTAILIRLFDGAPVLFLQRRVGLHGREFRVMKFRSMVLDAEARLEGLLDQNEISGHAFKLTDDPRLTRTGRWLRRTSLDELPQLWNVVRGEMSIVGPRPPLPREVAGYDVWHRRRLSMKPGITGLWQVSARQEEAFDRWVELDLDYIDRWSLWLDFKIMARTIPAMLQGR